MMRSSERSPVAQPPVSEFSGEGRNHRDFEKFAGTQGWQYGGQSAREHGLSGARRTAHEQIVPARGSDLQGTLGGFLPLDVSEVRQGVARRAQFWCRPRQDLGALEMIGKLDQGHGRKNIHCLIGPGGFGATCCRADQPLAQAVGAHGSRQDAGNRRELAVEAQLAQHNVALHHVGRDGAYCGHDTKGNRQIVVRALLGQICRRQIDGNAFGRKGEAGCMKCCTDPLATFRNRLVWQPHDREGDHSGPDLDLDINRKRLDALKGDGGNATDHSKSPLEIVFYVRSIAGDAQEHIRNIAI